jgi:hypothetical protein
MEVPAKLDGAGTSGGADDVAHASLEAPDSTVELTCVTV